MSKNNGQKKAIRALMESKGLSYVQAKKLHAENPCQHQLIVGTGYDGGDTLTCLECGIEADDISAVDAHDVYLECGEHTLAEARAANSVWECMQSYPIGDDGDGPVAMSCEMSYAGWAD